MKTEFDGFVKRLAELNEKEGLKWEVIGSRLRCSREGVSCCPISVFESMNVYKVSLCQEYKTLSTKAGHEIISASDINIPSPMRKRLLRACGLNYA